jgi:hypothetical protein
VVLLDILGRTTHVAAHGAEVQPVRE